MDAQDQIDHIIVYGTLMVGQRANKMMNHCAFEGTVKVPGTMYDLIGFPGVKLGGPSIIKGELFRLPRKPLARDETLRRLDQYECSPMLYTRRIIPVTHAKRDLHSFIYELNGTLCEEDLVPSGCWLTHLREHYNV